MKKIELLSPAGNMECLLSAIEAGCDAIYLSGKQFGARSFANNFTNEELKEAIKLCHMYGIKTYVTINTMIVENQFNEVIEFIDFLHKNNVDALIIQDIGLMDYIRQVYPNLEVHSSTQMHIHNLESAKLMEELGVKRVVLARETPIELIKEIKENTNLEIEIFIHGALCMCYSGQCLFSSLIGGRSGNKGTCSQCCRMKYDLEHNNQIINKDKYLLSTKDLNTLDYINELIDIGVDSLKIEGRMKSKEYVYLVTSLYKEAIDSYLKNNKIEYSKDKLEKLKTVFNRKYTKGFIFHEDNDKYTNQFRPNNLGTPLGQVIKKYNDKVLIKLIDNLNLQDGIRFINKNEDYGMTVINMKKNNSFVEEAFKNDIVEIKVSSDVALNASVVKTSSISTKKEIENIINQHNRKVLINCKLTCLKNNNLQIELTDNKNTINLKSDYIVEESIKNPITKERIIDQLNKLGNTIYKFNNIEIIMDDNIFINIKEINEIRRKSIELLNEKRCYKIEYIKKEYSNSVVDVDNKKGYSYLINNEKNFDIINNENLIDIVTDNIELYDKLKDRYNARYRISRILESHDNLNIPLTVGELGSVHKYNDINTDFSLNVANSYSVAFLHNHGVKRITLSIELTQSEIKELIDNYIKRYNKKPNLELIVSSYPEIMITKFNLLDYFKIDDNNAYLLDRFKNKYKLTNYNNLMKIYFYKRLELNNHEELFDLGINVLRIEE